MDSVFVRGSPTGDPATATTVAELVHDAREERTPDHLEIGRSLKGPFFPLADAFRIDATLRERFAAALGLPRASRYRRARAFLFLGLIPLLMLFELDRELAADAVEGASTRRGLDLFLMLACTSDLARPVPRHPRLTAIIFASGAARFALLLARSCGQGAHPLIVAAPLLALAAAIATAIVSPTRAQICGDIQLALRLESKSPAKHSPKNSSLTGAFLIAALLPVALVAAGHYLGMWGQALVMVAWGLILPQRAVPNVDDFLARGSLYFSRANVMAVALFGCALTAALTAAVHYGVDAVAYAMKCTHSVLSADASQFMAKESVEVSRNVHEAQHDIAFFVMTVVVAPLVEERVYRGMLQRVLGERFGPRRAIAIAASIFGFAHLGVYRVAIYQTLLLGASFGIAFEEGGLVASVLTHALWNLYLLV